MAEAKPVGGRVYCLGKESEGSIENLTCQRDQMPFETKEKIKGIHAVEIIPKIDPKVSKVLRSSEILVEGKRGYYYLIVEGADSSGYAAADFIKGGTFPGKVCED